MHRFCNVMDFFNLLLSCSCYPFKTEGICRYIASWSRSIFPISNYDMLLYFSLLRQGRIYFEQFLPYDPC
ncbi:hypothetical protein I7I53_06081 [Histoplasma capsulatum var. duboisii H88]|uniref:Uncharacterized protein n=1 Tax=Ajellomyces capsulatus (strain H88) TaxID=544711 RepID=A0A8A1L910_AJEC8|nr:hypothetical protein I7I53_06081 [Histoplasma capsulatum var. duboisii H88]